MMGTPSDWRYVVLVTVYGDGGAETNYAVGPFHEEHTAEAKAAVIEAEASRGMHRPLVDTEVIGMWPGRESASFIVENATEGA